MKAVSVVSIKKELKHLSNDELTELCLRLSKFKKENKELLTYLLFESHNETGYIETVKEYIDEQFELIQPIPGFRDAATFEMIMTYFGEDHHTEMPWKKYSSTYVSPHKHSNRP